MQQSDLTIRSLTARAVAAPLARPLRTASGDVPVSPLLLIDVASEEGPAGRAYIFGYTTLTLRALNAFADDLAGVVRGRPAAPAALSDELAARFRLMGRQGLAGMVLSGLDMALWDLQGRAQERPVVELLGGRAAPIPAYDSYGVVDPVADRTALERSVAQGFRAIKVKIGVGDLDWDLQNLAAVRELIGPLRETIADGEGLLSGNEIFVARARNVAVIPPELAINASLSGPMLRGSGVAWDIRKADPYCGYEQYDFDIPIGYQGDAYDRFIVRLEEMRQSLNIVEQALDGLPGGPHSTEVPLALRPPAGEAYARIESPRGELGYYLVSDEGPSPYRFHIRPPSLINLSVLKEMTVGGSIADAIVALGSIDIVVGEIDR